MNFTKVWNDIKNYFTNNYWGIILFFVTLIVGIVAIKIILNITRRLLSKSKIEHIAQKFIYNIIKVSLYLALILILLQLIGIGITGIMTAISAIVLALGLALQDNVSNLANGIILVSSKTLKKDDYITVDGFEGTVSEIHFLNTTIITSDNRTITIPNSTIVNNALINNNTFTKRRVNFSFSISYETDIQKARQIILDVMASNGKVYMENKPPFCKLKTLGDSALIFSANCWCDSEDYWDVYYYVTEKVFNEFKKNNISIPYNQMEIRLRNDEVIMPFDKEDLPKREEKIRQEEKKKFDLETFDFDINRLTKRERKERKRKEKNALKEMEKLEQNKKDDENKQ